MPKISQPNLSFPPTPNLQSAAAPKPASGDSDGKFKLALAKAAVPKKSLPQPAKNAGKPPKAVKKNSAASTDQEGAAPDENPSTTAAPDSSTPSDSDTDLTAKPSKPKKTKADSGAETAAAAADDVAVPTDRSTAASKIELADVTPPEDVPTPDESDADKHSKATAPVTLSVPSEDPLTPIPTAIDSAPSLRAPPDSVVSSSTPSSPVPADVSQSKASVPAAPVLSIPATDTTTSDSADQTSTVDADATLDLNVVATDQTENDLPDSSTPVAKTSSARVTSSNLKKTSVTPGQIGPIAQDAALQSDDATSPQPLAQLVSPAPATTASAEKAVDEIDTAASSDRRESKGDLDVPLDPSSLLVTDKLAPHGGSPSFAAHLSATASPADIASNNHDKIVQVVRSDLTPGGGTMKIRLDPPEFGALQVTVKMSDGVMTASFETSTDQATKMLSHSLGQLKTALESSGVSVEKLHVQQTPKDSSSSSGERDESRRDQARGSDDGSQQQRDQQRKEMIRRMWAKLGVGDPLDLVA